MENQKKEGGVVLIVDDEENLRQVLGDRLKMAGFEVLAAANGKEGVDLALEKHPDIILLDILMPIMDGWEMLGRLRQDAWGKKAKVIMLTVVEDAKAVAQALHDGSFTYLIKTDNTIDEVVERVRLMLRR